MRNEGRVAVHRSVAIQPRTGGEPSGMSGPVRPRGSWRTEAASSAVTRPRGTFVGMLFALRGAPCGDDSRGNGVNPITGRQLAARTWVRSASWPSPDRATETSRRPELTWPRRPFAQCQSRTRHFAGIPRAISARTAGQASNVDEKRPTTLFEGMRRSEYPTAPSIRMSSPSPGRRAYRPSSPELKSYSTELSTSASFVRISFALRGAPCGDDSRAWPAFGGYHDEEPTKIGPTDRPKALLEARVLGIGDRPRQRVVQAVSASSNDTPCSHSFSMALSGSQSKRITRRTLPAAPHRPLTRITER